MTKIFCTILYVKEDAVLERGIRSALQKEGIEPLRVPEDFVVQNGEIPESIRLIIDRSLFVLIVLSEDFEKSSPLRSVIKYAFSKKKMLLPYKIHPHKLGLGLRLMLGQAHWLDVSRKENPEDGISELCRVVKVHRKNFLKEEETKREIRLFRRCLISIGVIVAGLCIFAFLNKNHLEDDASEQFSISLPDGNVMEFVQIPPGGVAYAQTHTSFFLGKTEVTQAQYSAVMLENPSGNRSDTAPVEQVTWTDAMAFCAELTQMGHDTGRLPKHLMFSLPTSTQWLRAENGEAPGTDAAADLFAWYKMNSGGKTHPVAQKRPNSLGLYDMSGNVWEWCKDEDPNRINCRYFCGKDFSKPATDFVFPYNRGSIRSDWKKADVGFRVAVVPVEDGWERYLQDNPENSDKLSEPQLRKKERQKNISRNERERLAEMLLAAWDKKNPNKIRDALEAGASPDTTLPDGSNILTAAAYNGYPELVELLLVYGANPNTRTPSGADPMSTLFLPGETPARKNRTVQKIAELLCDYGFRINGPTSRNWSVLLEAVRSECPEVARVLIRYGANPYNSTGGKASIDVAREKEDASTWLKILKRAETPDIPTYGNGKTPDTFSFSSATVQDTEEQQESASKEPEFSIDVGDGNVMQFVKIPPDSAGNESFYLGKTEVTQSQYQAVMGENPSHFKDNPNNPVESVAWTDAMAFCRKLTAMCHKSEMLSKSFMFSLPTKKQWVRADNGAIPKSDSEAEKVAWFSDNSGNKTHPVGQKKANRLGLYDMHGNVWEWALNSYGPGARIILGRSFSKLSEEFEHSGWVGYKGEDLGFRVAIVPLSADEYLKTAWEIRDILLMEDALKRGANPNIDIDLGKNAKFPILNLAVLHGDVKFVELLLKHSADPKQKDYLGEDAVVAMMTSAVVKKLRESGTLVEFAEILCRNALSMPPERLLAAVDRNVPEVAEVLMKYGANPDTRGADPEYSPGGNMVSARELAKRRNAEEFLEIFDRKYESDTKDLPDQVAFSELFPNGLVLQGRKLMREYARPRAFPEKCVLIYNLLSGIGGNTMYPRGKFSQHLMPLIVPVADPSFATETPVLTYGYGIPFEDKGILKKYFGNKDFVLLDEDGKVLLSGNFSETWTEEVESAAKLSLGMESSPEEDISASVSPEEINAVWENIFPKGLLLFGSPIREARFSKQYSKMLKTKYVFVYKINFANSVTRSPNYDAVFDELKRFFQKSKKEITPILTNYRAEDRKIYKEQRALPGYASPENILEEEGTGFAFDLLDAKSGKSVLPKSAYVYFRLRGARSYTEFWSLPENAIEDRVKDFIKK